MVVVNGRHRFPWVWSDDSAGVSLRLLTIRTSGPGRLNIGTSSRRPVERPQIGVLEPSSRTRCSAPLPKFSQREWFGGDGYPD